MEFGNNLCDGTGKIRAQDEMETLGSFAGKLYKCEVRMKEGKRK